MTARLNDGQVLAHPFVIGELALGNLRQRDLILNELSALPLATQAEDKEVQVLITRYRLWGLGIGYIDAHLLASAILIPETVLWTRDKRLQAAATRLGVVP